jgi:WD40 repeat protein
MDASFETNEPPSWAVVSPNGERLMAAAGNTLYLWDVETGAQVAPPLEFWGDPDFGNFDASGRRAGLRVKNEGGVAEFDLTNGKILARGQTTSFGSIRHGWLNGERWVVLARKYTGSSLRDPVNDQLLFDLASGTGTVTSDFADQCNMIVLAGNNGASQIWDASTAQSITPRLWAGGRPSRAKLSNDGAALIISSSEPAVRVWKLPEAGGPDWKAEGPLPAKAIWWSPNQGRLNILGKDGRLIARESHSGREVNTPLPVGETPVAIATAKAGKLAFVGGAHTAQFWDIESGKSMAPPMVFSTPIRDIALSENGGKAAILLERQLLICDPARGIISHTIEHNDALRCIMASDGTRLATITQRVVQLWDTQSGRTVGDSIRPESNRRDACARFDSKGQALAVWWTSPELPGQIHVVAAKTGIDLHPPLKHPSVITDAVFSPDGDTLISASGDQRLWLWRTADGQAASAPILHNERINAVGFSTDGSLFWSRTGRLLHLWDAKTGDAASPVLRHVGPPRPAPGRRTSGGLITNDDEEVHVAWNSENRIATCDASGGTNVWNADSGMRPIQEMEAFARVLSMHRIDPGGGLIPLTREELDDAWKQVRQAKN